MKPEADIRPRSQTGNQYEDYPQATMDDTAYTMDDDEVLMGAIVSIAQNIVIEILPVKPKIR